MSLGKVFQHLLPEVRPMVVHLKIIILAYTGEDYD